MNISIGTIENPQVKVEFIYENEMPKHYEYLKSVFTAKAKELYPIIHNDEPQTFTFLVGLGTKEKLTLETLRNVMAKVAKQARSFKVSRVQLHKIECAFEVSDVIISTVEGIELSLYTFNKYKSDYKVDEPIKFWIEGYEPSVEAYIKEATALSESICVARDLINEPSSVLYPEILANIIKEKGEAVGLEVEILEGEALETLGMHAMLAVGNGSNNKPRLIVIRHLKGGDGKRFGLVGKGVTCDTGGYSLKTSDSMYYQKTDMSGAANVFGMMLALAKNNVPQNVVAVIPSCENVVSPHAYKIGDVLKSMSGKTIEVLNTDAEGRLALADAITYSVRNEKVESIVDLATLTGAVGATFGNIHTGTLSNNDTFYKVFEEAAEKEEEKFWRLPSDDAYRAMIDSDVADIKNTGGAGTITAGLFLREFVEDKPWIHLDIAATACKNPPATDYDFKGGTGVAIRTLYTMIKANN